MNVIYKKKEYYFFETKKELEDIIKKEESNNFEVLFKSEVKYNSYNKCFTGSVLYKNLLLSSNIEDILNMNIEINEARKLINNAI